MDVFKVDWQSVFLPDIGLLESFIRGTLVYFFVFLVMRSTLRRTAGELTMIDFIFVLLVAIGASDSMIGSSVSAANGFVTILTIVGWNYLLNTLSWHIPLIERWTSPPPLQIVKNGQMNRRNMRREFITQQELMSKLREEGYQDISEVKSAYLEGDGNISVVPNDA